MLYPRTKFVLRSRNRSCQLLRVAALGLVVVVMVVVATIVRVTGSTARGRSRVIRTVNTSRKARRSRSNSIQRTNSRDIRVASRRASRLVRSNGIRKAGLVDQDLGLDGLERGVGVDGGGGGVGAAVAVGLLDGEAAAEGAGEGVVAAADGADVAGGGADAVQVGGQRDFDREVLLFGLREAVDAWHVVGYGQGHEVGVGVAC